MASILAHHQRFGGLDMLRELLRLFAQGAEIAFDLDAVPEVFGLFEKGPETNRHLRCDRALAVHNFIDGPWSAAKPLSSRHQGECA